MELGAKVGYSAMDNLTGNGPAETGPPPDLCTERTSASAMPYSTRPPTNFAALESVQRHIDQAAQYIAGHFTDHCSRWFSSSSLESPLEAIFWLWWRALEMSGDIDSETVTFQAQQAVVAQGKNYRIDFVLLPGIRAQVRARWCGVEWPKIAVELDGHDFHERTKEQVAYRNQRDRDLVCDGWTVLHFSGSELFRDPVECVQQAFSVAYTAFGWDWERACREAEQEREAESKTAALKDGQAV